MLEFAPLFAEAGFPKGVVNVITGLGPEAGAALVAHPGIAHVGFTGGDATGREIYRLAAAGLKTVTLELGGKSPNIVFDDADLDQAVKGVVSGIFAASGQSCQAGSRLLLQRSIHDRFVEKLIAFVRCAKMGDPALPDTQIGPIATRPQFEKILDYIRIAKEEGARCVLGREEPSGSGRRHVHRAYDLHRRAQQHAHCAGGGLRPAVGGDSRLPTRPRPSRSATTSSMGSRRPCGRRACTGRW
jgi:aldehyde dehydrogenase (NAD+)